jgi:V/A-type H+-transporting ATPase subunit B
MEDGVGEGRTRADHARLANQLYAAYARVKEVQRLASIIGEEELSEVNRRYLQFGERFERQFVAQDEYENREFTRTLDLGWEALRPLPDAELTRVGRDLIERYHQVPPGDAQGKSIAASGGVSSPQPATLAANPTPR